jgi:hypothetical protein
MARRTAALKPQLNQIRTWSRDGRTDAWIAFQLGTTALTVQEFRSEHGLGRGGGNTAEEPVTPETVVQTISFDTPPPAPAPEPDAETTDEAPPTRTRRQRRSRPVAGADATAPAVESAPASQADVETSTTIIEGEPAERAKRRRRRGGRGGAGASGDVALPQDATPDEPAAAEPARGAARRKARTPASYKGSVVAGAVIVLDPAITRSAAWRANWADAPGFDVVIDDEQIVLRRRSDG